MTTDERLQFLLQSTESLHSTVGELTGNVEALTATVARHEKRWELLRRVMVAALQAGIEPEDGEDT